MIKNKQIIPVTEWPKHHSWPPIGGLRHLIHTNPKGFEVCVIRCGRRVLIDENEFFKWLKYYKNNEE